METREGKGGEEREGRKGVLWSPKILKYTLVLLSIVSSLKVTSSHGDAEHWWVKFIKFFLRLSCEHSGEIISISYIWINICYWNISINNYKNSLDFISSPIWLTINIFSELLRIGLTLCCNFTLYFSFLRCVFYQRHFRPCYTPCASEGFSSQYIYFIASIFLN